MAITCASMQVLQLSFVGKYGFGSTRKSMRWCHSNRKAIAPFVRAVESSGGECGGNDDGDNMDVERQKLMKMLDTPTITGSELRNLVMSKWNREYDVRLTRRGRRMYLQVFWKFLGQKSFPLTEEEYQMQLDAVAEYLTMWGVADIVRSGISGAKWAPGHTIGGGARAFSIPLGVDVGEAGRSNEWNSF